MEEYISIKFDLKLPQNTRQSILNTIVLLLRDIASMEDYQSWDDFDTVILNKNIERIKKELNNLKIIKFEAEDKQC